MTDASWEVTARKFVTASKVLALAMALVTAANAYIGKRVNDRVEELSRRIQASDSLAAVREAGANERASRMQLVLELQATALVEGRDSEDGLEAVRQLRALRRVMPR